MIASPLTSEKSRIRRNVRYANDCGGYHECLQRHESPLDLARYRLKIKLEELCLDSGCPYGDLTAALLGRIEIPERVLDFLRDEGLEIEPLREAHRCFMEETARLQAEKGGV